MKKGATWYREPVTTARERDWIESGWQSEEGTRKRQRIRERGEKRLRVFTPQFKCKIIKRKKERRMLKYEHTHTRMKRMPKRSSRQSFFLPLNNIINTLMRAQKAERLLMQKHLIVSNFFFNKTQRTTSLKLYILRRVRF